MSKNPELERTRALQRKQMQMQEQVEELEIKMEDGDLADSDEEIEGDRVKLQIVESDDPDLKTITVPKGCRGRKFMQVAEQEVAEEERNVAINYTIPCFPLDGARALFNAMKKKFGWQGQLSLEGMFGIEIPPTVVNLEVEPGKVEQIPWGAMQLSGINGYLNTGFKFVDGKPQFNITGKVKQAHKADVHELYEATLKLIKEDSIYRGKAIRITFVPSDFDPELYDPTMGPTFIDTKSVNPNDLILPSDVMEDVDTGLFAAVELLEEMRKHKIPRKRGVMLAGPYGCGKTETARQTAKRATDNGWTYIYLENAKQLPQGIYFAQQYQPAVVFVEDLDTVFNGAERNPEINSILNVVDGIDTKDSEVIVVFTTNHLDRISPAMIRPGRVDTLITFRPPDVAAALKLVRNYGRTLIDDKEDLSVVAKALEGKIPAFIREVVERSKLFALRRIQKSKDTTGQVSLKSEDLLHSIKVMEAHQKSMLGPQHEAGEHPLALLGAALGAQIAEGMVAGGLVAKMYEEKHMHNLGLDLKNKNKV